MSAYLINALYEIVDNLKKTPSNENDDKSIWESVTEQLKNGDSFHDKCGYAIEDEINLYIENLDDEDKISIWRETESGIDGFEENNNYNMDTIEIDLQTELFVEIIELANEVAASK